MVTFCPTPAHSRFLRASLWNSSLASNVCTFPVVPENHDRATVRLPDPVPASMTVRFGPHAETHTDIPDILGIEDLASGV